MLFMTTSVDVHLKELVQWTETSFPELVKAVHLYELCVERTRCVSGIGFEEILGCEEEIRPF